MGYLIIAAIIGVLIGIILMYFVTVRFPKRKSKVPSLTKYVAFSIAVLIVYAIAEMVVSTVSGVSHPELTTMIGSTFGGEILCCCLVKIFKLKEGNNE